MTIANPKQFTFKSKPVTYIKLFIELYYWGNSRQVYEIYGMIELKKMCILTAKNHCNFNAH